MKKNEIITAFFIAKKNILKNKSALTFTILIISLGFVSSIFMYGVMEDVKFDMEENFIETSLGHIVLEPYSNKDKIENTENILKKIKTLPNVVGASKISKKTVTLIDSNKDTISLEFYIINPQNFAEISIVDNIVKQGTWLNQGEKNKFVIGCNYIQSCEADAKGLDKININIGKKVTAKFSDGTETELFLQGIYDHLFLQTEFLGYITEKTAEEIFEDYDSNSADQIIIRLPNRELVDETIKELSLLGLNTKIFSWEEKASGWSSIVDSFSIIGDLSFLIGVIISSISVLIILYIIILTKETQIGIIKAIGIKSKVISLSYVLLSFFLGIIGAIIGAALTLSLILCFKLYPLETGVGLLVPQASNGTFFLVAISIIIASTTSGYFVSKKISKKNIIEAIFNG